MLQDGLKLITKRYSCRKYRIQSVEDDKIELCIEAARIAPSASNSQPWRFIVVNDPERKEKIASETYNSLVSFNKFVHQAPVIIVIVLEKPKLITQIGNKIKNKEWPLIDIGIAAEHFCLQAAELGLGTCMLGWYNEKAIKKILNIPTSKTIALLISVGYPEKETAPEKKRKSREEILSYNGY